MRAVKRQGEKNGAVVDLVAPEDVRDLLMRPTHWKDGRSAAELAYSWWDGVPARVTETLAADPSLARAICRGLVFEKRSKVPGLGAATRTDLVARFEVDGSPVVVAVEGKAGESFGELCQGWLRAGRSPRSVANRKRRLDALCAELGCEPKACSNLRCQLFVRSAAALFEARRESASRAIMLVHSFDAGAAGTDDFFRFARAIGVEIDQVNRLSRPLVYGDVLLQLGWARDCARGA